MIRYVEIGDKNIVSQVKARSSLWFIKLHKGKVVITINDLNELLGMKIDFKEISKRKDIFDRRDWNALGRGKLREEFEKNNNIRYEEETFFFVYLTGFLKILKMLVNENKINLYEAESIIGIIDNNTKYLNV